MSPVDRARVPAPGALRAFDFPDVERRPLSNGLDLRVCRLPALPVVSVHLFFRAGEEALDAGRAGLSVLTGDAVEGGTQRRSGAEFAEALEGLGARIGVSTGWEGTTVELSCLADRLAEALPLLAEAVLEPAFPEDEVERARDQRLATLRQRSKDPASLAVDHLMSRIFASATPYARPRGGTEASVAAMTRDHVRGYADAAYRPEQGALVIAGDVDAGEVEALVESSFAGWTGAPPPAGDFDPRPGDEERRIWVVDRPGSVQSEVRVGHVGTVRTAPDYFALTIMNMILGGSFTSRLNLNLRERNGFTYGVRSRFGFRSKPGPFYVGTAVGTEVTADAVREIFSELNTLVEGGASEDEVTGARDYAAGVFGLQLETADQIATRVLQCAVYGLADDYYQTYRDELRAVTAAQVAAAARANIRPRAARAVVVGDAKEVAGPLRDLGLGPVDVV